MQHAFLELTLLCVNGVTLFLNAEEHVFFSFVDTRHNSTDANKRIMRVACHVLWMCTGESSKTSPGDSVACGVAC